jgi:hypothetical protein
VHAVYHKEEDIHPYCHSLPEITEIITSTFLLDSKLLPNVLGNPKIIGQAPLLRVDFKAIFEGQVTEAFANKLLPLSPLTVIS